MREGLRVLQISPQDIGGGAERVAVDLHSGYTRRNLDARLLVRFRRTSLPGVDEVDVFQGASVWAKPFGLLEHWIAKRPHFPGRDTLRVILANLAVPKRWYDQWRGVDDFNYPYASRLLQNRSWRPNIIQLHNLHGCCFDLSVLPSLSQVIPVVWTLHDTWALTGHCGYFIDCNRWQHGCGDCPDLRRPPTARRDRTRENWIRKQEIYARSRIHLVCPSKWLMLHVEESILRSANKHIIPHGVDLSIFRPGDKRKARTELGLPQDGLICLFVAVSGASANPYKDYQTIDKAIDRLLDIQTACPVKFVCLGGETRLPDGLQGPRLFVGRVSSPQRVALYYQAADVYIHAANADNFPCTVLEAHASGLPVVATAVGGIPEQIEDAVTGYLVPRGDSGMMAKRIHMLTEDSELRHVMGQRAAERAARLFDLERQIDDYLDLYAELLAAWSAEKGKGL